MSSSSTRPTPQAKKGLVGNTLDSLKSLNPTTSTHEETFYRVNISFALIVGWFALFAEGMSIVNLPAAAGTYPTKVGLTVMVIVLVLAIWPIIKHLRSKRITQAVILIALIPVMGVLSGAFMQLAAVIGLAQALWALPLLGPLMGVAALIMTSVLVYKLASMDSTKENMKALKADVDEAKLRLTDADKAAADAGADRTQASRQEEAAHKKKDNLYEAVKKAGKELTKAEAAQKTAPESIKAAEAANNLQKLEEEATTLPQTINAIKLRLQDSTDKLNGINEQKSKRLPDDDPSLKAAAEGLADRIATDTGLLEISEKRDRTLPLDIAKAEEAKKKADKAFNKATTTRAVAAAIQKRDTTSTDYDTAVITYNAARKLLAEKEAAFSLAGKKKKRIEKKLDSAQEKYNEALGAQNSDLAGLILKRVALLSVTILFYSVWFGWVLSNYSKLGFTYH